MARVQLNIGALNYSLRLDAAREKEPELRVWLSQDVSCDKHHLECARLPQAAPLSLDFSPSTAFGADERVSLVDRIQHAYLNIDVFCLLRNKHGESCRNQAGSVRIPIHELLANSERYRAKLTIPSWGDPNKRGLNTDVEVENDKGWIEFRSSLITADGRAVSPLGAESAEFFRRVEERKSSLFFHYMGSCVNMFHQLGYTWPSVALVNAYVYQCRAGILPAAAYLGAKSGGTDAKYFERAAKIVLERHGATQSFNWRTDKRAPAMLGRVLTLAANLMAYIPDIVYLPSSNDKRKFLRRALESFDYARTRGGGDCEDLALEIILEATELLALAQLPNSALPESVLGMIEVRKRYVFCMVLGGVKSAEINGDYGVIGGSDESPPYGNEPPKRMGAHMWSAMIPRARFAKWWSRGNMKPEDRRSLFADDMSTDADEPPLILEGTGFLRPEGATCMSVDEMSEEDRLYSLFDAAPGSPFSGARKWFMYRPQDAERTFYKAVTILFTNEFLRATDENRRYICFAACRRRSGGGSKPTVGVTFNEFIKEDQDMCLWSEPAIDPVESVCIRDSMKNLYPMPPLRAEDLKEISIHERRLVKRLEGEIPPVAQIQTAQSASVEFFLKNTLLDEHRVQAMIEACRSMGNVVQSVECKREMLDRGLCAWRLVFRCKRLSHAEATRIQHRLISTRYDSGDGEPDDADDTF